MAYSQPLGLQQLNLLSEVKVRQQHTGLKGNKYTVLTLQDDVILQAKEEANAFNSLFRGKNRSFHMDLHDTQDILNFSLRRPYTFGSDKMEVQMNGSVVCVVRKQPTFTKSVVHINDAADRLVLRLKGDFREWDFKLQTPDKKRIGSVNKKFGGFFKEAFTNDDTYLVRFPQDLDVCHKAAVIGSCVLIDFMYHER